MNHHSNRLSPFSSDVLVRLVTLVAVVAIVLGSVVASIYFQERHHEGLLLQQQGTQRVEREFEFLSGEIDVVRSEVLYLAEQESLQRFLAGDEQMRGELECEYARFAARRTVYDQIRFLDTDGKEVIRVNFRQGTASIVPPEELQAKTDRYYYRDALSLPAEEVFVSEFDLNVEHGQIEKPLKPVLRFLTAVIDSDGNTRGLLALNYSGDHLLRRLNRLSIPGSTLLLNSDGQYLRGPEPDDAWGWLLGHSESFPRHFPEAWQKITSQMEGQFATSQGMFTFRHVSFSKYPRMMDSDKHTRGGSPAPLVLVSYLPSNLQYAASSKLLTKLLWIYGGAMILLVTLGWYWARSAAIRRQQAKSIVASEARMRTLSDQLLMAQEQERRSISRELHDELGQQVTAISLDLRSAARQQDAKRAHSLLERAIGETDHLLKSIHEVASRVRPSVLDDLGLQEAVKSMTSEISKRSGIKLTTELKFGDYQVSTKIGENVYRILQEGLTNILKHAETQQATATISVDADQLYMSLEDQGIGFDPKQRDRARLGLLGMQERVELLNGRFVLSSQPGMGTRIEIWVPKPNEENSPVVERG